MVGYWSQVLKYKYSVSFMSRSLSQRYLIFVMKIKLQVTYVYGGKKKNKIGTICSELSYYCFHKWFVVQLFIIIPDKYFVDDKLELN